MLRNLLSPERIEWNDDRRRIVPRIRERWNGGGFGPCWTQTPIGNVWNCGE